MRRIQPGYAYGIIYANHTSVNSIQARWGRRETAAGGVTIRLCVRIGTKLLQDHPARRLHRLARTADAAGIDSLWVPEAPFYWDAFAILGSLARTTQRVRLGTGVTSPYLRPPHLLAMSAATLDRLADGRAFLGLGRSLPQWYQRLLGMETGEPVRVMEETLALLRQWWRAPHEASSNGYFRVNGLPRYTYGRQPTLPVYLAAVGPRMRRLAARLADGLLLQWPTVDFVRSAVKEAREEASAAGRSPDELSVIVSTAVEVTEDTGPALDRTRRELALHLAVPGMERSITGTEHDVPSMVSNVREAMRAREVLGNGGWTRDFERVGDLEAAVRAIPQDLEAQVAAIGPIDVVRRRLAEYRDAGATHFFVPAPGEQPVDEYAELLKSIAPAGETGGGR